MQSIVKVQGFVSRFQTTCENLIRSADRYDDAIAMTERTSKVHIPHELGPGLHSLVSIRGEVHHSDSLSQHTSSISRLGTHHQREETLLSMFSRVR